MLTTRLAEKRLHESNRMNLINILLFLAVASNTSIVRVVP